LIVAKRRRDVRAGGLNPKRQCTGNDFTKAFIYYVLWYMAKVL
jgi:hypothetical protein